MQFLDSVFTLLFYTLSITREIFVKLCLFRWPHYNWLLILVPLVNNWRQHQNLIWPLFRCCCLSRIQPAKVDNINRSFGDLQYVRETNRYFKWNSVLCACFWITNMVFLDDCICSVNNLYFMVHWHSFIVYKWVCMGIRLHKSSATHCLF